MAPVEGLEMYFPPPPSLGSTVEATGSLQQNLDPRRSRGLYRSNTASIITGFSVAKIL